MYRNVRYYVSQIIINVNIFPRVADFDRLSNVQREATVGLLSSTQRVKSYLKSAVSEEGGLATSLNPPSAKRSK